MIESSHRRKWISGSNLFSAKLHIVDFHLLHFNRTMHATTLGLRGAIAPSEICLASLHPTPQQFIFVYIYFKFTGKQAFCSNTISVSVFVHPGCV